MYQQGNRYIFGNQYILVQIWEKAMIWISNQYEWWLVFRNVVSHKSYKEDSVHL
jgi:hypothetical protein